MQNQGYEIDLIVLAKRILSHWIAIVMCTILCAVIACGYTSFLPERYVSTMSFVIEYEKETAENQNPQISTFADGELIAKYCGTITKSDAVLQRVIDESGAEVTSTELANSIVTDTVENMPVLRISISRFDAEETSLLSQVIADYAPRIIADVAKVNAVTMISGPCKPYKTKAVTHNTMMGALIGLALSVIAVLIYTLISTKICDEGDIAYALETKTLGVIPAIGKKHGVNPKQAAMQDLSLDMQTPFAEAYKALRTNLEYYSSEKNVCTILFVSPEFDADRVTFLCNMARTLVAGGQSVVLADFDLRSGELTSKLQVSAEHPGISEVLNGNADVNNIIVTGAFDGIDILPYGETCPDPAALFSRKETETALKKLKEKYDFVLINAPSADKYTDAIVLSRVVDGTILLLSANTAHMPATHKCKEKLEFVKAKIIGTVLTNSKTK